MGKVAVVEGCRGWKGAVAAPVAVEAVGVKERNQTFALRATEPEGAAALESTKARHLHGRLPDRLILVPDQYVERHTPALEEVAQACLGDRPFDDSVVKIMPLGIHGSLSRT
jgi:hypothetical protein